MVEMVLDILDKSDRVKLDELQRAAMVGNHLVLLCSHEDAQPVISTGNVGHRA